MSCRKGSETLIFRWDQLPRLCSLTCGRRGHWVLPGTTGDWTPKITVGMSFIDLELGYRNLRTIPTNGRLYRYGSLKVKGPD